MFDKTLLMCGENNNPPERGYTKAALTIGNGYVITVSGIYPGAYETYGYRANMFGSLEPSHSDVYNICVQDTRGCYVVTDADFYYGGIKYSYKDPGDVLPESWKHLVGETITIWLNLS